MKEVVEFVSDVTGVKKSLVDVPVSAAKLIAGLVEETIDPFLTKDMIDQLQEDVVAKEGAEFFGLADIDVESSSMDKFAFDYLHRFRPGGHFTVVKGYH